MIGRRKLFIGGNWKCNVDLNFAKSHSEYLNSLEFDTERLQVAVCPTMLHIPTVQSVLNSNYLVCSQNVSMFDNGAFTGEVSAKQLRDAGVNWTLIGHSERRQYFGETEEVVAKKIKISLENGLNVIVCIGEKLAEREANQTMDVIRSQLSTIVASVTDWSRVVIAYEPVWAIGTGKTASPQQAQEVHNEIRQYISNNVMLELAHFIRIIYGGSVTDTNANELFAEKDIDGFLVGGASLKSAFGTIINSYKNKN
jgi:triosephosphate isomerase